MRIYRLFLFVVLVISYTHGDVKLSGRIQDMTLVADKNPYTISDNVIVPAGKKLVITRGCILLFKPFTGIVVEGTLIVQGEPEKPVVFTTENDTKFNRSSAQFPNPFDWNGIIINVNATEVSMVHFSVEYSVYGLKSYKPDIIIESGVFSHNGQSNLTVNENMKVVADGIPFNYHQEPETQHGSLLNVKEKKPVSGKRVASMVFLGGGAVSLGATGYFFAQAVINQVKYDNDSISGEMTKYRVRRNSSNKYSIISAAPTVLFSAVGITLLSIDKRDNRDGKMISISPIFGRMSGLTLTAEF